MPFEPIKYQVLEDNTIQYRENEHSPYRPLSDQELCQLDRKSLEGITFKYLDKSTGFGSIEGRRYRIEAKLFTQVSLSIDAINKGFPISPIQRSLLILCGMEQKKSEECFGTQKDFASIIANMAEGIMLSFHEAFSKKPSTTPSLMTNSSSNSPMLQPPHYPGKQ